MLLLRFPTQAEAAAAPGSDHYDTVAHWTVTVAGNAMSMASSPSLPANFPFSKTSVFGSPSPP